MTATQWGIGLFALAMLCLIFSVACCRKHPRIALAFEAAAFGGVMGMVYCAGMMHKFVNG